MSRIQLEKGITFNGEHSYDDYRMILTKRDIGLPNKNKILDAVPFSNVEHDFSEIYGDQTYGPRELTYTFTLYTHNNIPNLESLRILCVNWLMSPSKQVELIDDEIPEYHFLGEVRDAPECTFNPETDAYEIQVTFTCYPFKIGNYLEGSDDWDSFNFDIDVFQDVKFEFTGSLDVVLYNVGQSSCVPTVIASVVEGDAPDDGAYLLVALNGKTYRFGGSEYWNSKDFRLERGRNELTLSSVLSGRTWSIEFQWHKELL